MTTSILTPIIAGFAARVEAFSADLEAAVELAKTNILAELEGVRRRSKEAAPAAYVKNAHKSAERAKGEKRSPAALEEDTANVFALIQHHPGDRIESLAARSGMSTKDMVLPIKKLRADKRITTKGEKRLTAYYPAKGGK